MTVDELIEAAQNRVVTEDDIKDFEKRIRETEAEFADEMSAWQPDGDWYNRQYGTS